MATRKTHKPSGSSKTSTSRSRSSASKAKGTAPKTASNKAATTKTKSTPAETRAAKAKDASAKETTTKTTTKATGARPAPTAKPTAAKAEPKTTAAKAAPKAAAARPDTKSEPVKAPAKAPTAKAKPAAAKAEPKATPKPATAAKPTAAKAEKPASAAKAAPKPTAKAEKPAAKSEAPKAAPAQAKAAAPKAPAKAPKAKAPAPKPVAKPAAPTAKAESAAPKSAVASESAEATAKAAPAQPDATKAEPESQAKKAAEPKPAAAAKKADPQPKEAPAPAKDEKPTPKPAESAKAEPAPKPAAKPEPKPAPKAEEPAEPKAAAPEAEPEPAPASKEEPVTEDASATVEEPEAPTEPPLPEPRRSVAFIGSECYPFVKTGGLGDVMYALPKALIPQNCDVKVILPKYACIKQEYKDKMVYRGSFDMDLCSDGTKYYVGIMEYVSDDGVVYDFIDNEWFFNSGNPYTNLVDDIPKYCYFAKAALAALNYLDWIPDVIHCHDWQASLVPIYLKTMFQDTPLGHAKSILTIHNLRFQGKYDIRTVEYWSGLPSYVFNEGAIQENWTDGNMLKGGLAYADMITTVSGTYAAEIQTPEYGEGLDAHLRYHSGKLRGIVNGIDYGIWNPAEDKLIEAPYSAGDVLDKKKQDKLALQKELGLEEDGDKMVIGLISRLTNQKGLDLVNDIFQRLLDGNTQVVILGTGEPQYEDSFRWYENSNKGTVCSNIMYDEARSHQIYAGADALLVPSRFEPCGLTQLIAMHYGTIPVVRETGGLKDTVQPYNQYTNEGNGFTFDRYESGLLLDAINRAKTLYFTDRDRWDEMVVRDMEKDVSWDNSAKQYRQLYVDLTS